ncbi:Hypothetical protein I5071_70390 [Sandaracinus amylolyticus]|nr:Hypothetical protein I5071_70390 [Sandaracinus amylolyticus]
MDRSATATVERDETAESTSAAARARRSARATWAGVALLVGPAMAIVAAAVLATGSDGPRGPALIVFLIGLGATVTADRSGRR